MKAEITKEQDIIQATPTTSSLYELKDEVSNLSEKNSKEHEKFSKDIDALDKKLDEILEAQKRDKRKEEVKKFIESSSLGFEVFAGKIAVSDSSDDNMRIWIKIPNKEQTDFEYVVLKDIPEVRNYYYLKIFKGNTYNLPYFSPRGSVLISISSTAKADGNGFVPLFFHRFWFDIDSRKVTPVKDFFEIGEYFATLEIISGHSLDRIRKKIDKYACTSSDKNLLCGEKLYAYDKSKDRYLTWNEREEL